MTQNSNFSGTAAAPLSPRQNAQAMISAGVSAHRTGNRALAEQMFGQALELEPDNADAMQLMGLLVKEQGNIEIAEQWFRKSLAKSWSQPNVHFNLANLLLERGAAEDALEHYSQAVKLAPQSLNAQIQYGELLLALGRLDEAEKALKAAHKLQPDSVAAVVTLANLHEKRGQPDKAEKLLRDGLAREPENPYYLNNLGQLLTAGLRYPEAVEILQQVPRLVPDRTEIFVNLANALLGAGRIEDAIGNYLKAIQLDPLNYFAHTNLNEVLWQSDRKDEVGKSFDYAKRARPNHPDVLEMSAESLLRVDRLEEAEADLVAAEKLRPGTPGQFRLWTALRLAQGNSYAAMQLAATGLQQDPFSLDLLMKLCEALFQQDVPDQALQMARRMEELDPTNQIAISLQANAMRLLGDEAGAHRLYDYERFVHSEILAAPKGFDSLEAFNGHLAEKLDLLHHAQHEPVQQTLRNGSQTYESLFTRPGVDPAIVSLGEAVRVAAAKFVAGLPKDADHPFLRRKAKGLDWAGSWSVRLNGGGHHVDHIHPKGWISGVYYVDLPDCLEDESEKPGWIKFGEFKRPEARSLSWEKAVRPQPGMVVFFPSYMTHGTLPTVGDQKRLTVSFDIVPA